jgi:hypothetical protein
MALRFIGKDPDSPNGVRVNFVGNQVRLAGSAGQAAGVWLRGA